MRAVAALALVAAALTFAMAPSAHADGDPASDYLITQKVFFPYDLKVPPAKQQQLVALVDEANRAGFTLRVALISSSYDLGSITSLWQKPQTYARFLGAELKYVYKNRLLVVMPNGFGFNRPGRSSAPEYAVLAKIPVKPGPTGLVDSSLAAVQALAKASGVTLSGTTSARPSSRNHDRLIIVIAALAALAVAVVLRLVLRR
ncbi:MAG TPA: hypothetical protein VJ375_07345 [Gaiellaceae bacterium]|nr:hypothetical protein [Gaiellaceae bacterium]